MSPGDLGLPSCCVSVISRSLSRVIDEYFYMLMYSRSASLQYTHCCHLHKADMREIKGKLINDSRNPDLRIFKAWARREG